MGWMKRLTSPKFRKPARPILWPGGILLLAIAFFLLPQCSFQETPPQERYISIHLNDSLKRYDSVQVTILAGGDTNQVVSKVWSGPLPDPAAIPEFRLQDGDTRSMSVRVQGYDSNGFLILDMILVKTDGKQVIVSLPLPSPSVQLLALTTNPGILSPVFAGGQSEYNVNLANAESTLTFTAIPVFAGSYLALDTLPLVSGKASAPIPIEVGEKHLSLKVTAGDQSNIYAFRVIREGNSNVTPHDTTDPEDNPSVQLASLNASAGTLMPSFSPSRYEYLLTLANADSILTLTATPVYANAAITLNGKNLPAGTASSPQSFPVGTSTLTLQIAAATQTGTYAITALRMPKLPTRPIRPEDSTFPNSNENDAYAAWIHEARLVLHYGPQNFKAGTSVNRFPLLVRLTADNFNFAQAKQAGADLRFTNLNGDKLSHEIASWDSAGSKANIWVKVDSMRIDQDSLDCRMYWGNSLATGASSPSEVFKTEDGFSGVWHLSDSSTGKADDFKDATGKYPGRGGSGDGKNLPKRVAGIVGYGQDFYPQSTQGAITLPNQFDPGPEAWSFQVWLKKSGIESAVIFAKGPPTQADAQRFMIEVKAGYGKELGLQRQGNEVFTKIFLQEEPFTLLNVVYSGKKAVFYMDGYYREELTWSQGSGSGGYSVIGAINGTATAMGFHGSMDELWFSSVPHSPEWVQLSYECQKPGADLVRILPVP